jgi:hypothetical protein
MAKRMALCVAASVALVVASGHGALAGANEPLSEEDINKVVTAHSDEVLFCYRKHALKQKTATGRVTVGLVVERSGEVRAESITVEADGVRGKQFQRCVVDHVSAWRFPESNAPTEVAYPFLFQHTRAPGAGPRS